MLIHQKLKTHDEWSNLTKTSNIPSLRDSLHYNNYNTLLVSKLLAKTRSLDFIIDYANMCRVTVSSMNLNFDKIQYRILNQCLIIGLSCGLFLTTFKNLHNGNLVIPFNQQQDSNANFFEIEINGEANLMGDETRVGKYPGGANFCLGKFEVDNVQAYDYRIAYPLVVDRKNLSDETCEVLPANIVMHLLFSDIHENCLKSTHTDCLNDRHILARSKLTEWIKAGHLEVYDYLTHCGKTKTETRVLYHQYLYHNTYCGGQFQLCRDELYKRGEMLVILVLKSEVVRGVLSEIITVFNNERELVKNKCNVLNGALELVQGLITKYTELSLYNNDDETQSVHEEFENNQSLTENNQSTDDFIADTNNDGGGVFEEDKSDFGGEVLEDGYDCDNFGGEMITEHEDTEDFGGEDFNSNQHIHNDETINFNIDNNSKSEYKCVSRIFKIQNDVCCVDETLLDENPIECLNELIETITLERDEFDNWYKLLKMQVSSIYGCIGKLKSSLAALITCMIRTTLLQTGQHVIHNKNCSVYYMDTDSIFITNPTNQDLSQELNIMYPHTEMEMKTMDRIMFVQRKIYYYWHEGDLKYGQHTNGPPAWREMVQYFCKHSTQITTLDDIHMVFVNFYLHIYNTLICQMKKLGRDFFSDDMSTIGQHIKLKQTYKTVTPAEELKWHLHTFYPSLASSFRQVIYYYFVESDVLKTTYRPLIELQENYNKLDNDDESIGVVLKNVNLFKFYHSMCKTIYNIIKFNLKRNCYPFLVTLDEANFRLTMLKSFLSVYNRLFNSNTKLPSVDVLLSGNATKQDLQSIAGKLNTNANYLDTNIKRCAEVGKLHSANNHRQPDNTTQAHSITNSSGLLSVFDNELDRRV
uniref:DNA-directed DNA polymerase n=1 Tax=Nilaparvata lugens endogenous nudivirus TaxID=1487700 RepID=X5GE43_9VIRU|nr:DNAPOL [Nilaparvata lugens endogenous nudivirus]